MLLLVATAPTGVAKKAPLPRTQTGEISWYGPRFHGRKTANGERYNMYRSTCASRHLPFGTKVRVTNLKNGKKVTLRVNDRGPYAHGRILDVSKAAAKKLGFTGTTRAKVEVVR